LDPKNGGGGGKKKASGARGLTIALACYAALVVIQLTAYFSTHLLVLLAQSFETLTGTWQHGIHVEPHTQD
jgi:divalent metal cation (Fe/Co/Zn/Cd) transporter